MDKIAAALGLLRARLRAWHVLAALALVAAPATVWCGLDVSPAQSAMPDASRASAPGPSSAGVRLRCWQHGRLLFEERDLLLARPSASALEFRGKNGTTAYLFDTGSAVCLAAGDVPRRAD